MTTQESGTSSPDRRSPRPTRGRRPGPQSSRGDVLRAAGEHFGAEGYEAATIRAIAATAQVDPALVLQFFGSKDQLLAAVLDELDDVRPILQTATEAGDPTDSGRRLATAYFQLWEQPELRANLRSLVRAAIGSHRATSIVQEFFGTAQSHTPIENQRALAGSMLLGIAISRYVVGTGPAAQMSLDDLVEAVAPAIQTQLDAPA